MSWGSSLSVRPRTMLPMQQQRSVFSWYVCSRNWLNQWNRSLRELPCTNTRHLLKCWIQVFFQTSQGRVMHNQASSRLLSLNNIDRLSYLNNILIIKLPRPAHEAPLTKLSRGFVSVVNSLLLNDELLCASVEMNFSLNSQDGKFGAVPNISLVLSHQSGRQLGSQVVHLGECAFSQDQATLEMKLQCEIEAHPEVIMVIIIIIAEDGYHSPRQDSVAWNMFHSNWEHSFKHFVE